MEAFTNILVEGLKTWETNLGQRQPPVDLRAVVFALAARRLDKVPLPEDVVEETRAQLTTALQAAGHPVRLAHALVRAAVDPDANFLDGITAGVPVGASGPLPRTPAIFEKKVKWALPEAGKDWSGRWADNYSSVRERPDVLRKLFEEDEKEGMMVKITLGEATSRYGDHLVLAALGAIQKSANSEAFRIIFDGTHQAQVNNRIRVQDRLRYPTHQDAAAVLQEVSEIGEPRFTLVLDVRKAHRLVPIAEKDWGYQACRIDDEYGDQGEPTVWLNKAGTFGIGSAAYWWGREGALLMRLAHYLLGPRFMLMLLFYVDDGRATNTGPYFERGLLLPLLIFAVLHVPTSWKKVGGWIGYEWIGYCENIQDYMLGISTKLRPG